MRRESATPLENRPRLYRQFSNYVSKEVGQQVGKVNKHGWLYTKRSDQLRIYANTTEAGGRTRSTKPDNLQDKHIYLKGLIV